MPDNKRVTSPDVPDRRATPGAVEALGALVPRPRLPSPLQEAEDERFARHGVRLLLKRDDLIHPELTGNKWRKLVPNLEAAAGRPLLTFGGRLLEPSARHRRRRAASWACPRSAWSAARSWPTAR